MPAILQLLADLATGVALLTIPVLALYLVFSHRLRMNGLYWLLVVLLVAAGALHLGQAATGYRTSTTQTGAISLMMAVLSWATLITLLVVVPKLLRRRSAEEYQQQISRRELAETRLKDTKALFQSLYESLPLNVIRKDLDGGFVDCNQRFCDTLARSREDILHHTDFDFYPNEIATKYRHDDVQVIATGQPLEVVESYVSPSGEKLSMQVFKAPVRDSTGRIIGVQGMFWDVTQRMRAEESARASDAKFRKLVQSSVIGMIVANFDGRVLEANDAFLQTIGVTRDDLAHNRVRWDDITPPEYRPGDERAMATLRTQDDCPPYEKEFLHQDGHRVPVLIGVTMLDRKEEECICFVLDITRQKQTERDLKDARDAAEVASKAKSQFLANMSHEVRTPMNAVIGLTELVLNTPLEPQQREYLQLVLQSGEGLLSVINDVLDFSKVESGHVQLDSQPMSLRECLGDALKSLAVRAHSKQLELLLDIAPDVPDWFSADRGRLRQIVINLVSNAIKFTYEGEVLVSVRLLGKSTEDDLESASLQFAVTDTGIGIAQEKRQLIFEPFEQADASTTRQFGGTGLGLTIVQRLVELMGGRVELDSDLGKGSTFSFTLALETCSPPEQSEPPRAGSLEGTRVLVIEDHATSRRIIAEILRSWQITPLVCATAAEALTRISQESNGKPCCDLLLTGAKFADGDVWPVIEALRAQAATVQVPVILLLSHDLHDISVHCRRLGIQQRLFKPVKQSELLDAIATSLRLDVSVAHALPEKPALVAMPGAPIAVRSLHILLAEDSLVNQRLAVGVLERLGHQATIANNGLEVLALLKDQAFDLILMDVSMPELDGLATCARIRDHERATGVHLPIIAVTAHALKGDRERCMEAGMDGYVSKPIRQKQLIEEIDRVMGQTMATPSATKGVTTSSTNDAVNWQVALEFCGGEPALLRDIAEAFLEEWPKRMSEVRRALEESNHDLLHRAGHTVKGSMRYFGADRAFDAALALEELGQRKTMTGAEELWNRLQREVQEVIPRLVDFVQGRVTV